MSARDEQRAADYLRKHGEYDPNAGRRTRRVRPVLAGCAAIGFALICLLAKCSA